MKKNLKKSLLALILLFVPLLAMVPFLKFEITPYTVQSYATDELKAEVRQRREKTGQIVAICENSCLAGFQVKVYFVNPVSKQSVLLSDSGTPGAESGDKYYRLSKPFVSGPTTTQSVFR